MFEQEIHDHQWNFFNPIGQADFQVLGTFVDVKTCHTHGSLHTGFLVLSSDHTLQNAQSEELFFICALPKEKTVVLMGGISKADFKKKATKREPHEKMGQLKNHETPMWTIPAYELEKPSAWLKRIKTKNVVSGK